MSVLHLKLCAFALTDCTIQIESRSAKHLRAVHRTALELAVPNLYGVEIGGFWLKPNQVEQLKNLPDCYPVNEVEFVRLAVEAYLLTQIGEMSWKGLVKTGGYLVTHFGRAKLNDQFLQYP